MYVGMYPNVHDTNRSQQDLRNENEKGCQELEGKKSEGLQESVSTLLVFGTGLCILILIMKVIAC